MTRTASDQSSIDFDGYIDQARRERRGAMDHALSRIAAAIPITRRDVSVACTASLVSFGLFWTVMLTSPPTTEANTPASAREDAERARLMESLVPPIDQPRTFLPCEGLTACR